MPGNEIMVCKYLVENLGKIKLPHLGIIESVGAPNKGDPGCRTLTKVSDCEQLSTPDAQKKADIYLNGIGVSIKQTGASFSFNRIQRANIPDLFTKLGFSDIDMKLERLDTEVRLFHEGALERRNRPWRRFFTEDEFKKLSEFLMMRGSPNLKLSKHQAQLLLEASKDVPPILGVHSFDEYFSKYKDKLKIAIRRQWIGQESDSEHGRAVGLARKQSNSPWVFKNIVVEPHSWRTGFPRDLRRTVYFLMIEKER